MLDEVRLLAPILHPPSIRVFDAPTRFRFANPAAIVGPEEPIATPADASQLDFEARLAGVIGSEGAIGGFTLMTDWVARDLEPPKDHDFATSLGPVVVTRDQLDEEHLELIATLNGDNRRGRLPDFDWEEAFAYAARNTLLRPGDLLAGPAASIAGSPPYAPGISSRSKSSRSER